MPTDRGMNMARPMTNMADLLRALDAEIQECERKLEALLAKDGVTLDEFYAQGSAP